MKSKNYFCKSEFILGMSSIKSHLVRDVIKKEQNLAIVTFIPIYTVNVFPLDFLKTKNLEQEEITFFLKEQEEIVLKPIHKSFISRVHHSFYNILKDFIDSQTFMINFAKVLDKYKNEEIIPQKEFMFSSFAFNLDDMDFGIITDIYHEENTGIALNTYSGKKPKILIDFQEKIREHSEKSEYWHLPNDLSNFTLQGGLLLNLSLSGKGNEELWIDFHKEIISKINNKKNFIWILLGEDTFFLKEFINKDFDVLCIKNIDSIKTEFKFLEDKLNITL